MTTARALLLVAALALANAGWAADTDVENPGLRDLPLQRGPIYGGHQHQPTPGEIEGRAQERAQPLSGPPPGPVSAGKPAPGDDLYQRVLRQSERATPRVLVPDK